MTQAVAHILAEVERLSPPERADLADRIVETLAHDISPEIERAQIEEFRRRIAQVESGEVTLIPGEQGFGTGSPTRRIRPHGELMADYAFHPDALLKTSCSFRACVR
jgi:putative addiction module component (TIGR02574 family)